MSEQERIERFKHGLGVANLRIAELEQENHNLKKQVSELQSATRNEATNIIEEYVPWRHNDTHPRRVVLAYINDLERALD